MPAGCNENDALDYAKLHMVLYLFEVPDIDAAGYFFYCNRADIGPAPANISIDYAPDGDWSKAGTTPPGDHSKHDWSLQFANGVPCQ